MVHEALQCHREFRVVGRGEPAVAGDDEGAMYVEKPMSPTEPTFLPL